MTDGDHQAGDSDPGGDDRGPVKRSASRLLRRGLASLTYGNPFYTMTLGRSGARHFAVPWSDPWPGDARDGHALMDGQFRFGGQTVRFDGSDPESAAGALWLPVGAGADFLTDLHGFDWLRDLRSVSGVDARRLARVLVSSWIECFDSWHDRTWRPDILGLRLANCIGFYDFFGRSADDDFQARFFVSLHRQANHLGRSLASRLTEPMPGGREILALKGLIVAGVCLDLGDSIVAAALDELDREISDQVLSDGGHGRRNPELHIALLRHLVDLRAILRAGDWEVPDGLTAAIDTLTPSARMFRHGDGCLALFNGGREGTPAAVDAVISQAAPTARTVRSLPEAGFERIAAARTLIIMDTGAPFDPPFDYGAHAGALSFEMSIGRDRVIVNCGGYPGRASEEARAWNAVLRGTAAHSTVGVEDGNSIRLIAGGGVRDDPFTVTADREDAEGAVLVEATHDGYLDRFGLTHLRRLYLSADGDDLRGEDRLDGQAERFFTARFHLHPSVTVSPGEDGASAHLRTASGIALTFQVRATADDTALDIEESVYCGGAEAMKTRQLVVSGITTAQGATLKWGFRRDPQR